MTPLLSVVLPGLGGWQSVQPALDCWLAQTPRDRIEILLVAPDAEAARDALPPNCVAVPCGSRPLHEARAQGIRHATADYVVLAEDHCVPDPDYAEAILRRAEQGWDIIGPALRPGNPETAVGQASFLLGYGEWMQPAAGETDTLPGHNVVIRRERLAALGEALELELCIGAFLVARLRREGARCAIEPAARMRHFDLLGLRSSLGVCFVVGLGFGAARTGSSKAARLLYPLAAPAVALAHWARGLGEYRRAGRATGLAPSCLAPAMLLAGAWACGEAAGALLGLERVSSVLWRSETKPVSETALQRSAAREAERRALPTGPDPAGDP